MLPDLARVGVAEHLVVDDHGAVRLRRLVPPRAVQFPAPGWGR